MQWAKTSILCGVGFELVPSKTKLDDPLYTTQEYIKKNIRVNEGISWGGRKTPCN